MLFKLLKNLFGGSSNDAALTAALAKKPLLLDVRTASEFAGGSVPGAKNISVQELPARLKELKGHENIVVFCRSGARSAAAKAILDKNGFASVIDGGPWHNVNRFFN